jgi:pyruvate-formate lyase
MKKPEERLDRLERIAKLLVRAGLRARREMRQQDDKITIMIDAQIKNEERFAKLAQAQTELAESQAHTDRRLDALIDIVQNGRNGKNSHK